MNIDKKYKTFIKNRQKIETVTFSAIIPEIITAAMGAPRGPPASHCASTKETTNK